MPLHQLSAQAFHHAGEQAGMFFFLLNEKTQRGQIVRIRFPRGFAQEKRAAARFAELEMGERNGQVPPQVVGQLAGGVPVGFGAIEPVVLVILPPGGGIHAFYTKLEDWGWFCKVNRIRCSLNPKSYFVKQSLNPG